MIEAGVQFRDFTLDNPIRAIREISHDLTGRRTVRLAGGREASALDIQREYHARAVEHLAARGSEDPTMARVVELWGRVLHAVDTGDLSLIDREIDWAIKHRLVERYRARARPRPGQPADRPARPRLPRHPPRPRPVRPAAAQEPGRPGHRRRRDRAGQGHPAAVHAGEAARRLHRGRAGRGPRLHRRLGAPEAQRPGPAHRAVQGPVPVGRRARRPADRLAVSGNECSSTRFRSRPG